MSIPGFETREFVWFDVPLRRISVQTAHFGQSRWLLFPVVSLFVSGKEKTSETSSKMQGILHSENQEVKLFRGFWNDFRSWRWLSSSYWELFECPIESPANHWVVWEYNIYFPKKTLAALSFCVSVEQPKNPYEDLQNHGSRFRCVKRIIVLFVSASHSPAYLEDVEVFAARWWYLSLFLRRSVWKRSFAPSAIGNQFKRSDSFKKP